MSGKVPLTNIDSIQQRLHQVRFMKDINFFYLNALNKDIDNLEKINPDIAYALRGLLFAYQGKEKESLDSWNKAIKLNPSAQHYYNFGASCEFLGLHEESLSKYRLALNLAENNIELLNLLKSKFGTIYAYEECNKTNILLNKITKSSEIFHEESSLNYFKGDTHLMLSFGLNVAKIVSKYIPFRWIDAVKDELVEDRHYSRYMVKCFDNDDIAKVVACNTALSDFIVDFEEQHNLDLENFYVSCEAVE